MKEGAGYLLQIKKLVIYSGVVWCTVFAAMTFYWAGGGMLGVRSLGGVIYQKALSGDADFLAVVRLTGYAKLLGGLFLLLLLRKWPRPVNKALYYLSLAGGGLLFMYGLANFITLILDWMDVLKLAIEPYSRTWRLWFWEPFWMLGGILFLLSGMKFKGKSPL